MALLWIVFLSFDMALMGAIFYLLVFRKKRSTQGAPLQKAKAPAQKDPGPSILTELKGELASAKKTAADLEKKRSELDAFYRTLSERYNELDKLLRKAAESAKDLDVKREGRASEDAYSKAIKMLRIGLPVEEIVKNLGIPNGEAELISALNDYRQ